MGFVFIIYQVLLLLFGTVLGTSFGPDQYLEPFEFPKARRLAAANSPLDLKARTDLETVVLARKATFDFIHEPPEDGKEHEFAATAEVESQWPIFALERLDSDLNEVTCSDTQMQLFLNSLDRSKAIMQELEGISDFIIVTSHEGCDVEGERSIHKATNTAFDPERLVLSLDKAKCDWHDAFHSTQVSFSHRHLSRIQKRAYTFNKRQETDEPTTTKRVEGPTPDITIPTMSFSTTRLAPTATKALTQRYIDKKIFPPDFPAADLVIPQGVEVSCKNCTLQGYIEISKGSFNISGNGIKDAIAFFDHGSVDIVAKSLFSHIELGLDLSPSQALASLNMSLPTIPLTPFEIPGVVAFGPLIQPRFRLSVSLVEKIGFSYGFNLSVTLLGPTNIGYGTNVIRCLIIRPSKSTWTSLRTPLFRGCA
ncbi:hypothetical protein BDV25DRAFT_151823 [Aspergillus avenaceus]|uniref:Uncharacterized protein n=1 Tax=Aspergillus avenaceus TaxID=36643 RepID=A0A5N6U0D4_ASPAV|nr:hypothetical protein BDV25DRAFT_151823 [Aspergillus avenaceus]